MKNNSKAILMVAAGLIFGIALTLLLLWNSAPKMMLLESESKYGFDQTLQVFEETVIEKGWKIPVVHDLQKTMHTFGKDVRKVTVFELCHPEHAYQILSQNEERIVSALMPCRVAIYEKTDGKTYVSRMNTGLMGKMMTGVVPEVMDVASKETEEMILAIIKL